MYPAVMSNLLGKNNSPGAPFTMQQFEKTFVKYDEGFEYGSQLPDLFLRCAGLTRLMGSKHLSFNISIII